jgi:hypothetical protein
VAVLQAKTIILHHFFIKKSTQAFTNKKISSSLLSQYGLFLLSAK